MRSIRGTQFRSCKSERSRRLEQSARAGYENEILDDVLAFERRHERYMRKRFVREKDERQHRSGHFQQEHYQEDSPRSAQE